MARFEPLRKKLRNVRVRVSAGLTPRRKHHRTLLASYYRHLLALVGRKAVVRLRHPRRRIIAIGLIEHMGDIVACEPVAREVRRKNPDAYLLWVVRPPYLELVAHHPEINLAQPVFCLTEWMWLRDAGVFDEVIDLHVHRRICPECRIPLQKKCGDPTVDVHRYFEAGGLLRAFTRGADQPFPEDPQPRLHIPPRVVREVDALGLPKRFIVIHAISNESVKDWTDAKWREWFERCVERFDLSIVEVGLRSVIGADPRRYLDLCGRLSILQTAEVIRRADLFVGVDSGPAHLANAGGTPGVVLLGSYRAFLRYNPYSGSYADGFCARLIYHEGAVHDISVERVVEAVDEILGAKELER